MTRGTALAGTALVLVGSLGLQGAVTPILAQTRTTPPDLAGVHSGSDSATAAPGEGYSAGPLHRILLGDLRRDLWALPLTLPVLDLDSVDGGLTLTRVEEREALPVLVFADRDGTEFRFRPLLESAERSIPAPLRNTPVGDVLQDQMAAQLPLAALVVAELSEAADIPGERPRPVALPDDPRLGEHRERLAGRMGWIERLPGREEGAGSLARGIRNGDEIYEELRRDPRSHVDAELLLKARLLDLLVGDWDRSAEQWDWIAVKEDRAVRWRPFARDREWAFSRIDGILPRLTSIYFPRYVGFAPEYPDVLKMAWTGQRLDRTLLTGLERTAFRRVAAELEEALSDSAITRAVHALPPVYAGAVGPELTEALRARRDALSELAGAYYELLAGEVDVHGTDDVDSVHVSASGPDRMTVRATAPRHDGLVRFERTFLAGETEEVRLYLHDGDDHVVLEAPGSLPVSLRIIGGPGDDRYVDRTDGERILLYDDQGDNTADLGAKALRTDDVLVVQDSLRTGDLVWETRDWGSALVPRPAVRWDSDVGLYLGAAVDRYGFGFGMRPYRSRISASVMNGMAADEWIVDLRVERALGGGGWRGAVGFDLFSRKPTWYFGLDGQIPPGAREKDYRSIRNQVSGTAELHFVADSTWRASAGVTLSHAGAVEPGGRLFDELEPYGSSSFTDLGLHVGLEVDTRDRWSLPTRGLRGELELGIHPAVLDTRTAFGGIGASLLGVTSTGPVSFQAALHARVVGDALWGRAPYHRLPSLGGSSTLPGYVQQRFLGPSVASGTGLVRWGVADVEVVTDLTLGVHGLATTGRVWRERIHSTSWHHGWGGGVWAHAPAMDRTVHLTVVWGKGGPPRAYLGFGSIL